MNQDEKNVYIFRDDGTGHRGQSLNKSNFIIIPFRDIYSRDIKYGNEDNDDDDALIFPSRMSHATGMQFVLYFTLNRFTNNQS